MNAAQVKPRLIRDNGVWECALGNAHHVKHHFTGMGRSPVAAWRDWAVRVGPIEPAEGWRRDRHGHYIASHPAFPW